jgi:hypothetical protein
VFLRIFSLLVTLNIGPHPLHLLDPVELDFFNDGNDDEQEEDQT